MKPDTEEIRASLLGDGIGLGGAISVGMFLCAEVDSLRAKLAEVEALCRKADPHGDAGAVMYVNPVYAIVRGPSAPRTQETALPRDRSPQEGPQGPG